MGFNYCTRDWNPGFSRQETWGSQQQWETVLVINIFAVICTLSWLDSLQWFFGLTRILYPLQNSPNMLPFLRRIETQYHISYHLVFYLTAVTQSHSHDKHCYHQTSVLGVHSLITIFSLQATPSSFPASVTLWTFGSTLHYLLLPFMSSLPSSVGYSVVRYYNNHLTHVNSDWCPLHSTLGISKCPLSTVQIAWYVSCLSQSSCYISETISYNILLSYSRIGCQSDCPCKLHHLVHHVICKSAPKYCIPVHYGTELSLSTETTLYFLILNHSTFTY